MKLNKSKQKRKVSPLAVGVAGVAAGAGLAMVANKALKNKKVKSSANKLASRVKTETGKYVKKAKDASAKLKAKPKKKAVVAKAKPKKVIKKAKK